jgi:hypothetical protein
VGNDSAPSTRFTLSSTCTLRPVVSWQLLVKVRCHEAELSLLAHALGQNIDWHAVGTLVSITSMTRVLTLAIRGSRTPATPKQTVGVDSTDGADSS